MTAPRPDGSNADFHCVSLSEALRQPWDIFVFAVFLALLALPATTSLPLGEYHSGPRPAALSARLRRWLFLITKAVLVLAIVYCTSLDVAYAQAHTASNTRDTLQLGVVLLPLPVGSSLGTARPAPALPGVPRQAHASCTGGAPVTQLPCVEWHGTDVCGRSWAVARAGSSDELVQYTAVAVSGRIVERPVF